jgi:hypothetical protein
MLDAGSAGVVGTADVEGKAETFNVQRSTFNVQRSTFNVQRSTFNVIPPPSQHHRHYQRQHRASLKVETAITTPPALPASSIQYHSLANRGPNSTGPPSPHLLITHYVLRITLYHLV